MEKEEVYTGENEKWFEFNKKIVIRREDGIPYLIRRTLISFGKWFSIKYHKILVSDDQCMHCHPWPFVTIILKGGYFEWTPIYQKDSGEKYDSNIGVDGMPENCHFHKPGSVMYRPAEWIHRLVLADAEVLGHQIISGEGIENVYIEKLVPAHTLVFTGKVVRDWGFYTSKGWIFWKDYNKAKHC